MIECAADRFNWHAFESIVFIYSGIMDALVLSTDIGKVRNWIVSGHTRFIDVKWIVH